MIGVENLLRCAHFNPLWTFSVGPCMGNLYAPTCKHVHCSIWSAPLCYVTRCVISHYADSRDTAYLWRGV